MNSQDKNGKLDYIEFTVRDIVRTCKFYASAFGWSFKDYGPQYCEFTDERFTGGFAQGEPVSPGGPLVILYTDNLAHMQERIERAGGRVVKPVFAFPGGRRFHFADPDGYELAVWSDQQD
ncbi:MAG: VOC family protein [Advenella sp.]|uniref:VOC family protein n=1 Tax=Advenella sp. TaxID=1872388 RepID=UPI003F95140B